MFYEWAVCGLILFMDSYWFKTGPMFGGLVFDLFWKFLEKKMVAFDGVFMDFVEICLNWIVINRSFIMKTWIYCKLIKIRGFELTYSTEEAKKS